MMIDKRLLNAVPQAKKYVFLTVALRSLSLLAHTALIFAVSAVLGTRGVGWKMPLLVMLLSVGVCVLCNLLGAYTGFRSSSNVKQALRTRIYQKLLQLGAAYQEQTATAKLVQLAVEGVEQLETWFGLFLPQFYYSMIAAVMTFSVLAWLHLKMALVLLACVPLIPLAMAVVQNIAKRLLGKYWAQYASLLEHERKRHVKQQFFLPRRKSRSKRLHAVLVHNAG